MEGLFDVELAPGEPVTEPGTYVLDVESGSVRGILDWQWDFMSPPNARFLQFEQFLPEDGTRAPVLYDRTSERAFTWDDRSLHLVAGPGTNSGPWVVFRLGRDGPYVVLDGDLQTVRWFEVPPPSALEAQSAGPAQAWASPTGDRLLLMSDGTFHVVGITGGEVTTINAPGPLRGSYGRSWSLEFGVTIFSSGEGFGLIGRGTGETCRVMRYDWTGAVLSDVTIGCAFDIESGAPWQGPYLSPDGRLIAANTLTEEFREFPGIFERFTAVTVFDAVTGEALFRLKGAYWHWSATGSFYSFVAPETFWLADASALVVGTQRGRQIVSADGHWMPLPGTLQGALVPGPEEPPLFLLTPTTVVDQGGAVVATVSVERDSLCEPEAGHPADQGKWGTANRYVFFSLYCQGPTSASVLRPILPPIIERPPFEERFLLQVATGGGCLNIREWPGVDSESRHCLGDGMVVEAIEYNFTDSASDWGYCGGAGSCTWLHVRTDDGTEGWALSDYLRWAKGESLPDSGD